NTDVPLGQATITDRYGLAPYNGGTNEDRFTRHAAVGRISAVTVLSGSIGNNPWDLLTVIAENDYRQTSRTTYGFAAKLFEEPSGPGYSLTDCLDYPDPYDYDGSLTQALLGYNTCDAH